MKLPNGEKALIDRRKLIEYRLNPQHPTGRHKARVFAAAGITIEDVDYLLDALRKAEEGPYGTRYALDFEITHNSEFCSCEAHGSLPMEMIVLD